jgi:hypothetical protein
VKIAREVAEQLPNQLEGGAKSTGGTLENYRNPLGAARLYLLDLLATLQTGKT